MTYRETDQHTEDVTHGQKPSRWPRRAAIAAVVIVVIVAAAFGTRFGSDPGTVDSPLIGRPAPDLTLPYLESDGQLALRDLRGEVVVVNFWASWCVPCREEHPALISAAQRYEDEGVRFLGIVYQDQRQQAIAFLDELGRGYDYLDDPDSTAAIEFGVFGIPETYVIARDGTIAAKITGAITFEGLASTIEDVLAGRPPGRVPGGGEYESGEETPSP